jgi:hypothetical protein
MSLASPVNAQTPTPSTCTGGNCQETPTKAEIMRAMLDDVPPELAAAALLFWHESVASADPLDLLPKIKAGCDVAALGAEVKANASGENKGTGKQFKGKIMPDEIDREQEYHAECRLSAWVV